MPRVLDFLPHEPDQRHSRKAAVIVWPAALVLATGVGLYNIRPEHTPSFTCTDGQVPAGTELTIKAGANVRTHPHKPFNTTAAAANLAGPPLKHTVELNTDDVTVCTAETAGTWYGVEDNILSKITEQTYEGDSRHGVWINQVNIHRDSAN
jgi:hypothetical protein